MITFSKAPGAVVIRPIKTLIFIALWGCTAAVQGQNAPIKLATIAPEGSSWMVQMRAGADEIKTRTDGRVAIKFYGGGVMGNDKKVLRKIRIGQLQGGAFTSTALSERYSGLNLYGIPMLFRSLAEVDYVRERMDDQLQAGMREVGFESFGFAEGGFAYLMANSPVQDLEDIRGRKIWVPEGDPVSFTAMETLGLSPVVLPLTDVMTGLQTGLLDIVANSPVGALVLQWHTKIQFVTDLPISYLFAYLAIEERAFSRLRDTDQAIVREVLTRVYNAIDAEARRDNLNAEQALKSAGIRYVVPASDRVDNWRNAMAGINDRLSADGSLDPELLSELLGHLKAYRSQQVISSAVVAPTGR
jgi:TRAP-type C4-dicarboxylate transport system substrate-binding protein